MSKRKNKTSKIMTAVEALALIKSGDVVTTSGFHGSVVAEDLIITLGEEYVKHQTPKDLTIVYCAGQGDFKTTGLSNLGHPGLVGKIIAGHFGGSPRLSRFALDNKIQAYNFPQGVLSQMFRDIAAHKPRTISAVGLGTFVDPRLQGGKVNSITTEDMIDLIEFDGKEYLSYKTFPIDIAILRGSTADELGNISMEREALTLESQAQAMAVKNSGGKVIVQVERIAKEGTLSPRDIEIPGILVDAVVISKPENHWQTYAEPYNPAYSGETKAPMALVPALDLTIRKIITRRAAMELRPDDVINLGIGMADGIANVANEEGVLDEFTLTAEPGIIGGMPAGGPAFGACMNPHAIIAQPSQFDFYHGGGLDISFLGLAQVDKIGNSNVSKFGPKFQGTGGFIDISQNAKKVVFLGTFTASGLDVEINDTFLTIKSEGKVKKFVNEVEQITFSAKQALDTKRPVLYITERCVFILTDQGLMLTEVAPGIDIERDILAHMEYSPMVADNVKEMDTRLFSKNAMGLANDIL